MARSSICCFAAVPLDGDRNSDSLASPHQEPQNEEMPLDIVFVIDDAKPPAFTPAHNHTQQPESKSRQEREREAKYNSLCFLVGSQSSFLSNGLLPGRSDAAFVCLTGIETGSVWNLGVSPLIRGTTERVRSASTIDCVGRVTCRPAVRPPPAPPAAPADKPPAPVLAGCRWPNGPSTTAARSACCCTRSCKCVSYVAQSTGSNSSERSAAMALNDLTLAL